MNLVCSMLDFFNLSPREAENTDPAQRLALMSAYEAMEMAGLVPDRTPSTQRDRIGVFFGVTSDDWREVNSGQNIDTYFIPGGNRAFVPGRISYCFRFSGPSISVDTACSSSFAAISTACSYLRQGDCDSAIAGGTNVLTNPDNFAGLDRGHFLSTTGNCNPFDDGASGYCRADAVGAVVLKRLSDALADKDPIFGVIAGASTNHCGQSVSITRPHEGDQLSLFRRILRQSNTSPLDVSYVEMHGTGTQAGDAAEMRSVLGAMAWDEQRNNTKAPRPLHLGAVKANVGHAESASGVTALIKVLLMMQHSRIPPHRLDGPLNHGYPDLAARNVHIALGGSKPWRREECANGRRTAFLNNFSAAGGNTALLLEDSPLLSDGRGASGHDSGGKEAPAQILDPRSCLPVTVSARTPSALSQNIMSLVEHLRAHPDISLPALSYTTTARRLHHKFRVLVSGSDVAGITAALGRRAGDTVKGLKNAAPKIAFAFTGQGALYSGLGKQLFDHVGGFRADVCHFDRIAQRQGFPSFLSLIATQATDGKDATPAVEPLVAQLALTCVQMALSNLWTLWFGAPSAVVGHSLGEYGALYAAGVLSASDTIYLVGARAQLLTKNCVQSSHSMLAVKTSLGAFEHEMSQTGCTVACLNSSVNTVVSGSNLAVHQLAEALKSKQIETVLLSVPYAFHSSQMDPILSDFETLASAVTFNEPIIPYISPLLAETLTNREALGSSYLVRAARECVNFHGAIEAARCAKVVDESTIWVELGAHPACSGMIKQIMGSHTTTLPSLKKNADTWKLLCGSLEALHQTGVEIRWNEFHRGFNAAQTVVPLPAYKWDLKNYWIQYRHNFCLTKGDEPLLLTNTATSTPEITPALSSSVHRVLEQTHSDDRSKLLTESELHDPRLAPILSGHVVNGAMLCPSSLYADMALTIAKYMLVSNGLYSDRIGLDCSSMKVQLPLVSQPHATSQLLRVSADADWFKKLVVMRFFSVGANQAKIADHATCEVKITHNHRWHDEWKRTAYLVSSRISHLRQAADTGAAHKLNRGLVYKLFGSLVDYSLSYQGMERVTLDSESFEAMAGIKFQVGSAGFEWNPCWIDSLGHIAGFIMNGTENIASKQLVFVNHGWDAMRCSKPIEGDKSYTTYNRMHLESGTTYVGDTYVLEGEEIVAIFEGVRVSLFLPSYCHVTNILKFQGVNRAVLDHLLPNNKSSVNKSGPSKPKVPAPSQRSVDSAPCTKAQGSATTHPRRLEKQPEKSAEVLRIIGEEAQLADDELDLDAEFTDLGVDSLLSLTIASRLQAEIGLELSSSSFMEYSTIRSLVQFVCGHDIARTTASRLTSESTASSGASTPPSLGDEDVRSDSTDASSISDSEVNIMDIVRRVISGETGIAMEDLLPGSSLAELGVDSLLGLTLTSILSEQIDAPLPPGMISESETLADIESSLRKAGLVLNSTQTALPTKEVQTHNESPIYKSLSSSRDDSIAISVHPHATSVLLQGSPRRAKRTLFLFPDGAGSASSYMFVPNIDSSNLAVYGLNCPWLKNPQDLVCSLEHYVAKFLREVRRHQPHGPYILGGASAGGILAYEAARQLARVGERTENLILMDTPNPVGLENPNQRMYDFLDSMGMFGLGATKKAPTWLRPHFDAFLGLLDAYSVQPFARAGDADLPPPPPTLIIYARDGMCKNPSDPRPEIRPDDPREMLWLINNRTDFSGTGWNSLVGSENLTIQVLDNVNHYTILQPGKGVEELAEIIKKELQD